jgi:hypothetical protein
MEIGLGKSFLIPNHLGGTRQSMPRTPWKLLEPDDRTGSSRRELIRLYVQKEVVL